MKKIFKLIQANYKNIQGRLSLKNLQILFSLLLIGLHGSNVSAAGTIAGTVIKNQASLSYDIGANTIITQSAEVTIEVQELINATLISQDVGKQKLVAQGQSNGGLLFELTNTGNGDEGFVLYQNDVAAGDQFDIGVNFDKFYIDTDTSDGAFNILIDTVYDNSNPPVLAPDTAITVWAVSNNFPVNLNAGDKADVIVNALAKSFESFPTVPVAGDVVTNVAGSGIDAIYGTNSASTSDTAAFILDNSAITVSIEKSVEAITNSLGVTDTAIPGAEVTYRLTVKVEGVGTASNLEVIDPLPTELKLKGGIATGTITLIGSPNIAYSAASGDDAGEYNETNNTITVNLSDTVANTPATERVIEFTTVIQ